MKAAKQLSESDSWDSDSEEKGGRLSPGKKPGRGKS